MYLNILKYVQGHCFFHLLTMRSFIAKHDKKHLVCSIIVEKVIATNALKN